MPINIFGFTPLPLIKPDLESSKIKHLVLEILYLSIALLYGSLFGLPFTQSSLGIIKFMNCSIFIFLTIAFKHICY